MRLGLDLRGRSGGRRGDGRIAARSEPGHPDLVLDAAGDVERLAPVGFDAPRQSDSDVGALRSGDIDVLDDGRTWPPSDRHVTDTPAAGARQGDGLYWPTIAVDRSGVPHHGRIYFEWTRYISSIGRVELAWSDDRGDHWSQPVFVDDVEVAGDSHILARVVVDGEGRVCVTYRLLRPDSAGATEHCDDNCPGVPNPDQHDTDQDEIGDACDD